MSHNHNHISPIQSLNWVYYLAIALNFGFVILEAAVGLGYHSMGLFSDAGHKLFDVFSLVIALVAFKLASSKATSRFTYGYKKTSILISLLNAVLLFAAVSIILVESCQKFVDPPEVSGAAISWTAAIGILVSGISALLLMKHQKGDINTRGAFLHMATDSLISLGVVISGIIINLTGWYLLDPIVSIIIALVILHNTVHLLGESFRMSVDAMPDNMDYNTIIEHICSCDKVESVHDLHVWSVSIMEKALTARVQLKDPSQSHEAVAQIKEILRKDDLDYITIETF